MAIRDAIVLNTTGSNFQAVQSGDTVRIQGDSTELLSIENSSETRVFSVGTSTTSVNIEGNVTSSKPISGSSTSTASFGYFVADTYEGDAREIATTLPRSSDILSGSSQIAGDVSGSFSSGFNFGATADQLYVGVSGSNSSHSASISGSSRGVSSGYVSGSDLSHLQVQQIGHIRGVVGVGTWSNVGSLITGRRALGTSGTTNATVGFGGCVPGSTTCTELWNGSSWSSTNAMITPYHSGGSTGIGVQDAALGAAGFPSTYGNQCTNHWDGTNWSAGGAVIQRRFQTGNAGTVNAALLFGGRTYTPALTNQTCTEEYNGTSWSETGASGPAYSIFAGGGLQNAAFAFLYTDHDQYDGTTWSEAASLPSSKQQGAAAGTVNSTLTVGGLGSPHALSLHYDGTTWTSGGSLSQTQYVNGGNGTQGAALAIGGGVTPGTHLQCTAVYDAQQTITGSFGRIEAGYVLGNAEDIKGQIPRDAGLVTSSAQLTADISGSFISGFDYGVTADELYVGVSGSNSSHSASISGSSAGQSPSGSDFNIFGSAQIRGHVGSGVWSAGGAMSAGRYANNKGGTGVENAAIIAGAGPTEYAADAVTEHYNGTSWTAAGSALSTARRYNSLTGTQNAALAVGGLETWTNKNNSEIYNGATWTAITALPTISGSMVAFGTQNAAAVSGLGTGNPGFIYNWNGTSWSTPSVSYDICQCNENRGAIAGGSQNSGFVALGYKGGTLDKGFTFDGTSFTATANLNTARNIGGGWGTANSAIVAGGINPGHRGYTELWDGTTWSETSDLINNGRGGGSAGVRAESGITTTGGGAPSGIGLTEHWTGNFINTGSFGRIEAGYLKGDAGNIGAALASGSNVVSGSVTLAADISGSWDEGFNFGGTFEERLIGVSGSGAGTPGVSGASAHFSQSRTGHPSLTGLSVSGSDLTHLVDTGHIRGMVGNGTWTVGPNLIAGRECLGAAGTPNAALVFGGDPATGATEKYDGSSWSELGDMVTGRGLIYGIGTDGAAMAIGGWPQDQCTEEWNGAVWSAGDTLTNDNKCRLAAAGTQNAGLAFGGGSANTGVGDCTEEYNGTSWSAGGAMTDGSHRERVGGTGLQNAALAFGGADSEAGPSPGFAGTEEYNGTTWSEVTHLITPRTFDTGGQAGTQNAALAFGGRVAPAAKTCTEHYDGTSWSEAGALAIAGRYHAGGGTSQAAFSAATDGDSDLTQFWTGNFINTGSFGRIEAGFFTGDATKISSSLFAGTGAISSSAQIAVDVSGSFISGINVGGTIRDLFTGVSGSASSSYGQVMGAASSSLTGSDFHHYLQNEFGHIRGVLNTAPGAGTWSAGGSLITARNRIGGFGVANAAISFGGLPSTDYEQYDGTTWSETSALSDDGRDIAGTGTLNAGLAIGGNRTANHVEKWDGSTWTQTTDTIEGGANKKNAAGTQNDGLVFGGGTPAGTQCTEHFNGTSWSAGGAMLIAIEQSSGQGLAGDAIQVGGGGNATGNVRNYTEEYNGTAWSAGGTLGTARRDIATVGTTNQALAMAGATAHWMDVGGTNTEHYNGLAWSVGATHPSERFRHAGAGLASSAISFGGGVDTANDASATTQHYSIDYINTGSFGQVFAQNFTGDGSGLASTLPRSANIISGSPQIADDVSGSFVSGFNFGGTFEDSFTGISGSRFTPGVSGSSTFFSSSYGHPALIYQNSTSGSDHSPLLQSEKGHIRGTAITGGTFSVASSLINGRNNLLGAGVQNAAITFGGYDSGYARTCTEHYNGTSWSAGGTLNRQHHNAIMGTGHGIENAALKAGGAGSGITATTEEYDGSVWTNVNSMITGKCYGGGAGTQNAALSFAGTPQTRCTEHYNGTSWRAGGAMIVGSGGKMNCGAGATEDTALAAFSDCTEEYNGNTWATGPTLPDSKDRGTTTGTQNAAIVMDGLGGSSDDAALHYDGTGWSVGGTSVHNKYDLASSAGLQSAALKFGGDSQLSCTEEYNVPFTLSGSFGRVEANYIEGDATEISSSLATAYSIKTSSSEMETDISGSFRSGFDLKGPITSQPIGAWKRVADSVISRTAHTFMGNQNNAIVAGDVAASCVATEKYDGTVWSTFVDLPNSSLCAEAAGDVGSELIFKGKYSGSVYNTTIKGDGTSFSQDAYTVTNAPNSTLGVVGGNIGTQNAALSIQCHAGTVLTEEYDGSTWSTHSDLVNNLTGIGKTGTVNSAIAMGGTSPRGLSTEEWDGMSWGTVSNKNTSQCGHAAGGTTNDAITLGGRNPDYSSCTNVSELYDGVTWTNTSRIGIDYVDGRGDAVGGSAGAMTNRARVSCVWETNYESIATFGRVEPKYGIITDTFSLKNKYVNDENTLILLQSNTINDSINLSGSMGDTSYTSSLGNYHSASFTLDAKHTGSAGLLTDAHPPKFGRSSFYSDGSGGITISGSADGVTLDELAFGTGDFTVEYWVRFEDMSTSTNQELVDFRQAANSETQITIYTDGSVGDVRYYIAGADRIDVATILSDDVWQHHALVRYNAVTTFYIDGRPRGTYADTNNITVAPNAIHFGRHFSNDTNDLHGQMDAIRVSNIARYTMPFIPEEGEIESYGSGSITASPYTSQKYESATFKLPQFTNFDQPAILTQTLFQSDYSSSLSTISGSRTGRSGSGMYIKEENVGTVAGDMWFNRENNSLNFTWESSSYSGGVWAAGGDILTPYDNRGGGTGVPDAAVSFNAGGGAATASINYDGAAWSISGTMILARTAVGSAGTSQNAALAIGGYASPYDPGMCTQTEAYDGMTWSEVGDLITGRKQADGAGAQNAALFIGGYDVAASANSDKTEEYNGSAWSAGGALIIARQVHSAAGEQYAALAIAGKVPSVSATMEEYNGSVWSAGTAKITALAEGAADGGVGSVIMAGSGVSPGGQTEEYNGSTWKAGPVLITGRQDLESASVGFASTGKGLVFGGRTPGATRATEEYTNSGVKTTLVICALTGSQA